MGASNQQKLNWLQLHLPDGLFVDAAWLQRHGYYSSLRAKYTSHGWLEQIARGVYRRPFANTSKTTRWQQAAISLQMLLDLPFTVGARTALELQGFAHYLTAGTREVHLYGPRERPGWTSKLKLDAPFIFHNAARLFKTSQSGLTQQAWGQWDWPLILSSPERAILELLDEVPASETFHQVDMLMEGLRNLSPRRLQTLLAECRSVKVKRLFLWFAERHNPPWLKAISPKKIDLGAGKRMLVRGGILDPKYQITVPRAMNAAG